MNIRCRPLYDWPPEFSRKSQSGNPFRALFSETLNKLERECHMLGAEDVVIELGLKESEIRMDGWPRADARRPPHPGVIVSFDSKYGPLRYGTDAFPDWKANLRAIALGLESLRRIDRYGIGKRGEQYQGWRQLEPGKSDLVERGQRLIRDHGSVNAALKATHPDLNGDPDEFLAVQAAREAAGA